MQPVKLNFRQRIGLESLWFVSRLFAILPYWFKYYVVENVIFFILYYCIRYRKEVVMRNLRNSFPEKSEQELAVICRRFYRTLAEMFIDTINMAHMSDRKMRKIIHFQDAEKHRDAVHGRNWIAMMAHYGCWEYGFCWGFFDRSQMLVAVYHPLQSPVMELFYQRLRTHENAMVVSMADSLRFYLRNRETGINGKNIAFGLVADQNPRRRPDSRWFRFLNQDTIFFDGGEKLALRCHLPVYFVKVKRIARGRYEMAFEPIYDGEEEVAEYEITERYIHRLEAMIRECPELWMWSHRRWKHKRPNVNR